MRVLSGKYKGKKLISSTDKSIRPTTNKIKEFIFNILQDFCKDKFIADIFCGSGSLGIESLSRDSRYVVFVDNSVNSINVLKKNISQINLESEKFQIINNDAIAFSTQTKNKFDLLFIDPPFHYPPLNDLIVSIFNNRILKKNGILVIEHEISNTVNFDKNLFEILKQKKIGRSMISFITHGRSKCV
jgi:16S rRNA (guanine(966)-N(2))-methyltransferase RsmD